MLWQISTLWRRKIEAVLRPLDLTHPQFVVLACLGWLTQEGKHVQQKELAQFTAMDITVTSQILRNLEKRGYLTRRHLDGDERAKYPFITESGQQLLEQSLPLVETTDRQFFEVLGNEQNHLIDLFDKLLRNKY
jgi:DNA-binding MarR family transcriptional regulator